MNRRIIFVFIVLFATALGCCKGVFAQVVTDSNWTERVKTVTLYKNGVELEPPVLTLGSEDRLLLRFDVLGAETENYRYRIRHCNSRWEVDDLEPYEFLNGFDKPAQRDIVWSIPAYLRKSSGRRWEKNDSVVAKEHLYIWLYTIP
jgi:hypothetical protein